MESQSPVARAALTAPIQLLAMSAMLVVSVLRGLTLNVRAWIELGLSTPVVLWGGWPFFEHGWASVVRRRLNMFTLIAVGTGTDVAMESAGITLVKGDLRGIVRARGLSRAMMRVIRQNQWFAFAYNALGVPLAAGVLFPVFGLFLSPMIASAAMSFSSVSVITNALRLRKAPL